MFLFPQEAQVILADETSISLQQLELHITEACTAGQLGVKSVSLRKNRSAISKLKLYVLRSPLKEVHTKKPVVSRKSHSSDMS